MAVALPRVDACTQIEWLLAEYVNGARVYGVSRWGGGLQPLAYDDRLADIARAHSADMARRHFFHHVNPEGLDHSGRMLCARYPFMMAGENIARIPDRQYVEDLSPTRSAHDIALRAHDGLMHSVGHRKNILLPDAVRIGVGVQHDDGIHYCITELFAG